jgi:Acyl carrier protein
MGQDENDIIKEVKKILVNLANMNENVSVKEEDISDYENISESALLQFDSLKAIRMIVNLEERFDIMVPDEDLIFDNFNSPEIICKYLNSKLRLMGGTANVDGKQGY